MSLHQDIYLRTAMYCISGQRSSSLDGGLDDCDGQMLFGSNLI